MKCNRQLNQPLEILAELSLTRGFTPGVFEDFMGVEEAAGVKQGQTVLAWVWVHGFRVNQPKRAFTTGDLVTRFSNLYTTNEFWLNTPVSIQELSMQAKSILSCAVSLFVLSSLGWSQAASSDSPVLLRIERQTREENVCMLLQRDGHYHLERVVTGRPRVFEGTLDAAAVSELDPLLNSEQLTNLKQAQIETSLASEDMDQLLVAVARPNGWQSLNFPNGKSRKPYKATMDPLVKWLDRYKQQQNPIVGVATNRCMPSQTAQSGGAETKPNSANPYIMRIVVDHYEPASLGGGSADALSRGGGAGSMNNASAVNSTANLKISRVCAVVYESGRYRLEKSTQQFGSTVKSDIYRDTLDKSQLDDLRKILDNPKLSGLPNSAAPAVFAKEGELITLAIPRGKSVQALSFASFFGARTAEVGMKDNTSTAVSANVELTHPIRKWVKQNVEEHKTQQAKDVPSTVCIPSTQPE